MSRDPPPPTRLSSPPPSRSMPPIGMGGPGGAPAVEVGGVRSRFSRSPSRSPWEGMTAAGASVAPGAPPVSWLSELSPLGGGSLINTELGAALMEIHAINDLSYDEVIYISNAYDMNRIHLIFIIIYY